MRLFYLPTAATVLVDIAAWLVIHLGVATAMASIPSCRFDPACVLFRAWRWERKGSFYAEHLAIRSWKAYLPDGAPLLGRLGFPKRHLESKDPEYLAAFARETCRAELTHWIIAACAPLFFLWNKPGIAWLMLAYAAAENLPLIAVQRYNRFRLLRTLRMDSSNRHG